MQHYSTDVLVRPMPLVVVVDESSGLAGVTAGEWLLAGLEATGLKVRWLRVGPEHRFPKKKEWRWRGSDGRPLEHYEIKGILKRNFYRRQSSELPSVVVVVCTSRKMSGMEMEASKRIETIKGDLAGREVAIVCLAVVEVVEDDEEDKATRKRLASVGATLVTSCIRSEQASCGPLAKAVLEYARAYYVGRARRVKKWEKNLKSPALLARYEFKMAWWFEAADDKDKAVKAYRTSYSHLKTLLTSDGMRHEARAVADVANLQLCRLAIDDAKLAPAAQQMLSHVSRFGRSSDEPATWGWLCTQHLAFAQLLRAAPHAPDSAPAPNWPRVKVVPSKAVPSLMYFEQSYHYAAAAAYASRRFAAGEIKRPVQAGAYLGLVADDIPVDRSAMVGELVCEAAATCAGKRCRRRLLAIRTATLVSDPGIERAALTAVLDEVNAVSDNCLDWASLVWRVADDTAIRLEDNKARVKALARLAVAGRDVIMKALALARDDKETGRHLGEAWYRATFDGRHLSIASDLMWLPCLACILVSAGADTLLIFRGPFPPTTTVVLDSRPTAISVVMSGVHLLINPKCAPPEPPIAREVPPNLEMRMIAIAGAALSIFVDRPSTLIIRKLLSPDDIRVGASGVGTLENAVLINETTDMVVVQVDTCIEITPENPGSIRVEWKSVHLGTIQVMSPMKIDHGRLVARSPCHFHEICLSAGEGLAMRRAAAADLTGPAGSAVISAMNADVRADWREPLPPIITALRPHLSTSHVGALNAGFIDSTEGLVKLLDGKPAKYRRLKHHQIQITQLAIPPTTVHQF